MDKKELLILVGFVLIAIAGLLFMWAWPMLSDGIDQGLFIFLWALVPLCVGGSLIVIGVLE